MNGVVTQDDVMNSAVHIIDKVEEILDRFDISIPCQSYEEDERREIEEENSEITGEETKIRIFGEVYFELEDFIRSEIEKQLLKVNDDEYKCEVRKV